MNCPTQVGQKTLESAMVFGWFKSKRTRRSQLIRNDRKYLEVRSRRFLQKYLKADESRKPHFYRAVEDAVHKCRADAGLDQLSNEREDADIATATSTAAMNVVLERIGREETDGNAAFLTDAYATIALAYHRAAGVYIEHPDMQELGTAAVHLLTMATSYVKSQQHKDQTPGDGDS